MDVTTVVKAFLQFMSRGGAETKPVDAEVPTFSNSSLPNSGRGAETKLVDAEVPTVSNPSLPNSESEAQLHTELSEEKEIATEENQQAETEPTTTKTIQMQQVLAFHKADKERLISNFTNVEKDRRRVCLGMACNINILENENKQLRLQLEESEKTQIQPPQQMKTKIGKKPKKINLKAQNFNPQETQEDLPSQRTKDCPSCSLSVPRWSRSCICGSRFGSQQKNRNYDPRRNNRKYYSNNNHDNNNYGRNQNGRNGGYTFNPY